MDVRISTDVATTAIDGTTIYDTTANQVLVWKDSAWCNVSMGVADYQSQLENMPISEIEKFLRTKKLENIKTLNESN